MGEQETGSGLGKGLQPLAALGFEFNRLHWQRQKQWSLEKLTHNRILREEPQAESRQPCTEGSVIAKGTPFQHQLY